MTARNRLCFLVSAWEELGRRCGIVAFPVRCARRLLRGLPAARQ